MTLLFNRTPIPPSAEIGKVAMTPEQDQTINNAIVQSVQEFPPAINTGAWFGTSTIRGVVLPAYGTKARDQALRDVYHNEYNNLAQSLVSGLTKKFCAIPWRVNGSSKDLVRVMGADGRTKSISAPDHYTLMLQNAHFGDGYESFASRFWEDVFTQDFGGIMEKIGPGDASGPIAGDGVVTDIAHLDAGRSYITGNPYFPIMYFSLISGSLHRMHRSRIIRIADQPSPDERFFGIGMCALSRAISIVMREQYMARYIENLVDDKPAPGILLGQGFTEKQRNAALAAYGRDQQANERPIYGKTMWIYSLDADKPIKMEHFPFSTAPEKFDWVKYVEIDVHALAAAFNIDVQEIWELTGRQGMGSTAQSQVLHTKSEGKMPGWMMQMFQGSMNRLVLTPNVRFEMMYNDPVAMENAATVDGQLMTTVVNAASASIMSPDEGRRYLAMQSERFKDSMVEKPGQLIGTDAAEGIDVEETDVDDAPEPPEPEPMMVGPDGKPMGGGGFPPKPGAPGKPPAGNPQTGATPGRPQPRKQRQNNHQQQTRSPAKPATKVLQILENLKPVKKAFSVTAADFERQFTGTLFRALDNQFDQDKFETRLLDLLSVSSVKAYVDGLKAGGVNAAPNEEEQAQIHNFLVAQIDYIDGLGEQVYTLANIAPDVVRDKARMWVNKSLKEVYYLGLESANGNGMYEWQYGDTEHCEDCQRLDGQVHRLKDYSKRNWIPQGDHLACGGFNCRCILTKTNKMETGDF